MCSPQRVGIGAPKSPILNIGTPLELSVELRDCKLKGVTPKDYNMNSPDREYYITFLFEQLQDFNTSVGSKQTETHRHPKFYADTCLIVLFALLTRKGISVHKYCLNQDFQD